MKSRQHPGKLVAQVRKIIGKSQSQFAALVGVSKHTIISVENGRNTLSKNLARRIQIATGAQILNGKFRFEPECFVPTADYPGQLTHEASKFLRGRWDGTGKFDDLYTRQDFDQWRANFFPSHDGAAQKSFDEIKKWIEFIFKAAAKPGVAGNRDRLPAVYQSLVEWLNETRETFKLQKEVDDVLEAETRSLGEFAFHAKCLTAPTNPDYFELLKDDIASYGYDLAQVKKLAKQAGPSDWIVMETEILRAWDPFNGRQSIPCTKWKLLKKPSFWIEFGYDVLARTMKTSIEELVNHQPEALVAVEKLRHESKDAARKRSQIVRNPDQTPDRPTRLCFGSGELEFHPPAPAKPLTKVA